MYHLTTASTNDGKGLDDLPLWVDLSLLGSMFLIMAILAVVQKRRRRR